MTAAVASSSGVSAGSFRVEGNFDLGVEIRRDADAEYNDRQLGFDRAFTRNSSRNHNDLELASRRAEFRAFAYPAPSIEIFAKVFQDNDLFLGEAHAKYRVTSGERDHERGLESYLFYRQGRLGLSDPLLNIADDGGGAEGIATTFWFGRGEYTLPKGRWFGEFNMQNLPGELNGFGEDNEAYAARIRHEYKFNDDLNVAGEALWAHKSFTFPGARRESNDVIGFDFTAAYKTTNFALQYHPLSISQSVTSQMPHNDALGTDLRNLVILDKPKTGRVGLNVSYLYFGRNYANFVGRGPEFFGVADEIVNGNQKTTGDFVGKTLNTELYWDVPRYNVNVVYRHNDKWGRDLFPTIDLARKNEIDINAKLVHNFTYRVFYNRTLFGTAKALRDYDANRFLFFENKLRSEFYTTLKMNRESGSIKVDYRNLQDRTVNYQISGIEGSYKLSSRMTFLARAAQIWLERPDQNYTITSRPSDIGGGRTSLVDPFFRRLTQFYQLAYRPTDNSQLFLEYGQGFHTDNDLSLDGDFLAPTRRTDPRVFMKLEMWF